MRGTRNRMQGQSRPPNGRCGRSLLQPRWAKVAVMSTFVSTILREDDTADDMLSLPGEHLELLATDQVYG